VTRFHPIIPFLLASLVSARAAAQATDEAPPDAADVAGELAGASPDAVRAADLTRRAIRLIHDRDWERAEAVLNDALRLAPHEPINLYNLACARAQLGRGEAAVEALERAAAAGFGDFALLQRDPDLDPVRGLPRYTALVRDKDRWQRRAAERVLARLRNRLGEGYASDLDPDHRLIYAASPDVTSLAELKDALQTQWRGQRRDLFERGPDAYVTVVVPSAVDYRRIMRYHNVGGAYFDATKTLVAQRTGTVMRHEFTHALHAADLAPLGQEHAPWVAEGLGVLYESAEVESERGGDVLVPLADNGRLPAAAAAAKRRSLVPLSALMEMSAGDFLKRPNLTYAQAGAVMLYLRERGWLRTFYDTYKRTCDADRTGRTALEQASGLDLPAFEAAWTKWLLDRPPAPLAGGAALFLGAQVAPGGGGMSVVVVPPTGPAAAAGIEPRDVILSVNGKPVKDYASLRPAIGSYAPGKELTLRVRRGGKEFDATVKLQSMTSTSAPLPQ
jgi:hypothetical protein